MCATAAVPVWKAAGMSFVTYSKICADLIRKCQKVSVRPETLSSKQVHYPVVCESESEKPGHFRDTPPDELKMFKF